VVKAELNLAEIEDKNLTEEQEQAMRTAGAYYFVQEYDFEEGE
jgi:hypothetical protein